MKSILKRKIRHTWRHDVVRINAPFFNLPVQRSVPLVDALNRDEVDVHEEEEHEVGERREDGEMFEENFHGDDVSGERDDDERRWTDQTDHFFC